MNDTHLYPEDKPAPKPGEKVFIASHLLHPAGVCITLATYKGLCVMREAGAKAYDGFEPKRVEHVVTVPGVVHIKYEIDKDGNTLIPIKREKWYRSEQEAQEAWEQIKRETTQLSANKFHQASEHERPSGAQYGCRKTASGISLS